MIINNAIQTFRNDLATSEKGYNEAVNEFIKACHNRHQLCAVICDEVLTKFSELIVALERKWGRKVSDKVYGIKDKFDFTDATFVAPTTKSFADEVEQMAGAENLKAISDLIANIERTRYDVRIATCKLECKYELTLALKEGCIKCIDRAIELSDTKGGGEKVIEECAIILQTLTLLGCYVDEKITL